MRLAAVSRFRIANHQNTLNLDLARSNSKFSRPEGK